MLRNRLRFLGGVFALFSTVSANAWCTEENYLLTRPIEAIVAFNTVKHDKTVAGIVNFKQNPGSKLVTITGRITGLEPGKHGFHISESGDMSSGCYVSGTHLNPHNVSHGAPTDKVRHVGDLGNVVADENGIVKVNMTDTVVSLYPDMNFIIGRVFVVHEWFDDMGRGGHPDSKLNGNGGGRITCGVIAYR